MTQPTPKQIIEAFDEVLDFVYGRSRGRDYPSKFDAKVAAGWIELGLTIPIASAVFYDRMRSMHERWLHNRNAQDKTNIPEHLNIFDDNIKAAIIRVKAGGEPIAVWEQSLSQWHARIAGWVKNPAYWQREQWGEEPSHPDYRGPKRMLTELVPVDMLNARRKASQ